MGRDKRRRFVKGHQHARRGWLALVEKRFNGDMEAAKTWLGKIGAWADDERHPFWMRWYSPHPGTPEEFMQRWQGWKRRAELLTNGTEVSFL
ncbi:MAG: hypothetical protein KF893_25600 [Caldilineaceae bacterium]|nr:hypothetical protein [Caldilineaceae bacterium]